MRCAFFGGSFDPPHLGHLRIARIARERLALDAVLLAPVGRQPLKADDPTPFAQRLAMVRLLVEGEPGLAASEVDAPGPQPGAAPNYTVDTLPRLRAALTHGAQLFLLAGADSFLTLPHWRSPERLLQAAADGGLLDGWILAARPGFPLDTLGSALPPGDALGDAQPGAGPVLTYQVVGANGHPAVPIHLLPDLDDPATATRIREALGRGEPPPDLSLDVARYIEDHALYRVLR